MTAPDAYAPHEPVEHDRNPLLRVAIWVAIGALVAAALVCVVWVLIGPSNGIIGRAFLTILLLAAFAGVAILDAHLAPKRPAWFALASMASWVIALLIGAVLIWMPERYSFSGFERFLKFLLIVLILQLALLHLRLLTKGHARYVTTFTRAVTIVTIVLVVGLAVMLIVPIVLSEWVDFSDLYWRIVVAVTILAAVGTALIPLVNALFAPKRVKAPHAGVYGAPTWPTYVDGVTPLPVLADGTPDWNAYYTGHPTAQAYPAAPSAPAEFASPQYPAQYPQQWATDAAPGANAAYGAPSPQPYDSTPAPQPYGSTPASQPYGAPAPQPYDGTQAQPPFAPPVPPNGYDGYPPPPPLPPRP
ncbi:hypothetical protein AB1K54_08810 [Microbacterium sp. BWT-B31]|uniref:hypothetical protein n=1 Tax=Microbacterium sp. BWT-B31 TaxID=3232072 RepID=UPI003528F9F5